MDYQDLVKRFSLEGQTAVITGPEEASEGGWQWRLPKPAQILWW